MFYIGCHLSCSKGFTAMERDAERIGATTFQFFTRNPRGSSVKALDLEDIREFLKRKEEKGLGTLVAHAPYTLNACSADEKVREFARNTMADDLERLEHTPGNVCEAGNGNRDPADRRNAERDLKAGAVHHSPSGDHGRKGQRGGKPV